MTRYLVKCAIKRIQTLVYLKSISIEKLIKTVLYTGKSSKLLDKLMSRNRKFQSYSSFPI